MPSALDTASLAWSSIMTGAANWCAFSEEGDETLWSVMGGVPVKGIVGLTAGLGRVGLLNQWHRNRTVFRVSEIERIWWLL